MNEIWKDIPNYEGLYKASNLGGIKSLKRVITRSNGLKQTINERILKPQDRNGYLNVSLYMNKISKMFYIHQLIAISFLNHSTNDRKIVVDHIDNDKSNNKLENLQLITQRENCSKDQKNKSSKYTGVSWRRDRKKWRASIRVNGKKMELGLFTNEEDANLAYQEIVEILNIKQIR